MKTISEYLDNIRFNEYINESFVEPHLRDLAKQLKNDFNKTFHQWSLQWDRIDSSLVHEYPATEDIDKIIRKNKPCFVFGIKDNKYVFYIDPSFYYQAFDSPSNWHMSRPKQYEIFDACKKCDSIVILDYEKAKEKTSATDLRWQRTKSTDGMILRHEGEYKGWGKFDYNKYCTTLAQQNIDRYKNLIAQAHAQQDDGFDKISDSVNALLQRAMKLSIDLSAGKEYLQGKSWDVRSILSKFYGESRWDSGTRKTQGNDGLLKLISDYLDMKDDLRRGKSYNPTGTEKASKRLLEIIKEKIEYIDNMLKKLEK